MSSIKQFLDEDHPSMFVSTDGKIGQIRGVSFVRVHVYVKTPPRFIPERLWYWLADRFTTTVTEVEEGN